MGDVTRRGPEFDLLPALGKRGVIAMAYSPVRQGRLPTRGALKATADRHDVTPHQIGLAWVTRGENVLAIPKSGDVQHVRQNWQAADLVLTAHDLVEIDAVFASPQSPTPLEML